MLKMYDEIELMLSNLEQDLEVLIPKKSLE
jgi:hypothetical protein